MPKLKIITFSVIFIVVSVVIYQTRFANQNDYKYVIKDNTTSFLCDMIGKVDITDDFRTLRVTQDTIKSKYKLWQKSSSNNSCNNIDKVIIE